MKEYNVGDQIPAVKLPDSNGEDFSTASMQGIIYLTYGQAGALSAGFTITIKAAIKASRFQAICYSKYRDG